MAALTSSEAQARAALITVASYEVFLDLTASPVSSRAEVRFRCAEPGAATFADVSTPVVTGAVLNGTVIASPFDGRLVLNNLLAENVLTVGSELSAGALTRFTDPSDGAEYTLGYSYPTGAPKLFCCFDQPGMPAPADADPARTRGLAVRRERGGGFAPGARRGRGLAVRTCAREPDGFHVLGRAPHVGPTHRRFFGETAAPEAERSQGTLT